jgi:hypothetical protein
MSVKQWNGKPKEKCEQGKCEKEGYKVMEIAMRPPTFCKDHYIEYLENRLTGSEEWLSRETKVGDVKSEVAKFLHLYDISVINCGSIPSKEIKEDVNLLKKITNYECRV